jgi:alkanesulfonate monooxygenase SsuD/methylene tetrahydromethanopterin reductase-like flavin-dependent oxidoreductase (luciferase family)
MLVSPEHLPVLSAPLEEGAAVAGRSLAGFDIAPTVQLCIDDDLESARDAVRPFIALYVGGMGSRKQNFYNALVRRYGFEDAAREVQDLFLEGRREEAAAALPGPLIDMVALVGPSDRVRERLRVYAEAGVGTLGVSPLAVTREERIRQLRLVAELAEDVL